MVRKNFDVEVPDGQHLGFSRDTDGAYRAHLFNDGTNDLAGHAELFEPDEDDGYSSRMYDESGSDSSALDDAELSAEELVEALEALISLVVIVATLTAKAAPHVKRWWNGQVLPPATATWTRLESLWHRMLKSHKAEMQEPNADRITPIESEHVEPFTELEVSFRSYRARMSSAEAQERFVAALLARAFSDKQMRMLREATIENDEDPLELERAMVALTPQHVENTLKLMLEKNPSLLTRESLAELETIFARSQFDGEYVPLRIERIKEVPHDGRMGL